MHEARLYPRSKLNRRVTVKRGKGNASVFLAPCLLVGAAVAWTVAVSTPAQTSLNPGIPIVRDWSQRYLAYGNNSFRAATLSQLERDPRLLAAWVQRAAANAAAAPARQSWRRETLRRDWRVSLGNVLVPGAPEVFPAMWGQDFITTSCSNDFVVFPIRADASSSQANIVAFHNLYDDCGGTVPRTYWAYYVGNGPVRTSPVLSLDGREVAFVENRNRGESAWFHVLRWQAGQGTSPTSPAGPGNGSWVRSVQYAGSGNRRSSPFVDYWNNVAFVGANNGVLYAIGPVFAQQASTELKVLGSVTVNANRYLTSPVLDPRAEVRRLFISDGSSLYSYRVTFGQGSVTFEKVATYSVDTRDTEAIQDSPLVDIDRSRVFWFARRSNQLGEGARVIETDYTFGTVKSAQVGQASDVVVRAGAFDDAHYNNHREGQLHVCGKGQNNNQPRLYTFRFDENGWNSQPSFVNTIATSAAECSPLTTFQSGLQDRLFLGVSLGLVQMWNLPITASNDGPDASASYSGGSSGIIIDNRIDNRGIDNRGGATRSNIYFQNVGASGDKTVYAVKLTQAGLQ